MTAITLPSQSTSVEPTEIIYPSSDGEPVAETYDHLYAILTTLEVLKQHLQNQRATVLANQNLFRTKDNNWNKKQNFLRLVGETSNFSSFSPD